MCDKVFYEDKNLSEKEVIKQIKELFQVDKLFFVPWDINDFTGHADGMVRFIDNNTVLITTIQKRTQSFKDVLECHCTTQDLIELNFLIIR